MKAIRAVLTKEFLELLRNKRSLALIILMPLVELIIYGYGINMDVKHLALAVYDEDHSQLSRRLIEALEQSAYFDVTAKVSSQMEMRREIDSSGAKAGLHIPPVFAADLLAGRKPKLQMLIDGTDSSPANTALHTSQAIITAFLEKERILPVEVTNLDYRPRLWYNPDLKSVLFTIPGLMGLLLQLIIPMITATSVVQEKEIGTIEQLLVTPIKPYEFILGKFIPHMGVGLIITTTILAASGLLFHVPVRGSLLLLYILTVLFIGACLGLGLLASTVAHTQQQAAQIVMFLAIPSILLSGFIFPRESMPTTIYHLSNFLPLTYFLIIIRGIMLKGLGLIDLWPEILVLLTLTVTIIFLSIKKFHKRLS